MSQASIIDEIINGVLTGGRRTKAVDVRKIFYDILAYIASDEKGIIAFAAGGITGAYQLTKINNRVDTCLTNLGSVKATPAIEKDSLYILNNSTKKINVFPKDGQRFIYNGVLLAVNQPIMVAPRNSLAFYCFTGEPGIYTSK